MFDRSFMEANQGDSTDEEEEKNKQKIVREPDQNPRPLGQIAPVREFSSHAKAHINPASGHAMAKFNQLASKEIHWPSADDFSSDDDLATAMTGTDKKLPRGSTRYDPNMDVRTLREILADFTEDAKDIFRINLHPGSYDSELHPYQIAPTEDAVMLLGQMPGLTVSLYSECIGDTNIERNSSYDNRSKYRTINWEEGLKAFTPYILVDRNGKNRIIVLCPSIYVDRTDPTNIKTSVLGMQIYEVRSNLSKKLECVIVGEVIPNTIKTYQDFDQVLQENFGSGLGNKDRANLREINTSYHAQRVLSNLDQVVFKLGSKSVLKADNALVNVMGFVFGDKEAEHELKKYIRKRDRAQKITEEVPVYTRQMQLAKRRDDLREALKKRNAERIIRRREREIRKLEKPGDEEYIGSEISSDEDPDDDGDWWNLGGKKNSTKKCRTKKYSTKKCSTKKCRTKKYSTKKCSTKKCVTKKCSKKNCMTKKNKIS